MAGCVFSEQSTDRSWEYVAVGCVAPDCSMKALGTDLFGTRPSKRSPSKAINDSARHGVVNRTSSRGGRL